MRPYTRHLGLMVCSSAIAHIGMGQGARPAPPTRDPHTRGYVKWLNYSGSDTGASGNAEGKLDTLAGAGVATWTNPGFEQVDQAALITSSADNTHGQICNLPAAP